MSDISIRQYVIDELNFEPRVEAAHIGVAVNNGIVTLSGHVGSYAEKVAAERAAKRVKGVLGIAQEIEVRYPSDKKSSDEEIAERAIKIIAWDVALPAGKVKVKVEKGVLTLTGEVEWNYQRAAAAEAVRKLSGVIGVVNDVTVRPRAEAGDIQRRIEEALKRNASVDAHAIRVLVRGGKVTLEGRVHAWQERTAAANAAWSAPGVTTVEAHLLIS
jgi:osmotically-inducible protein OsmY